MDTFEKSNKIATDEFGLHFFSGVISVSFDWGKYFLVCQLRKMFPNCWLLTIFNIFLSFKQETDGENILDIR